MTRDIVFHIGPRNCGKSEFVEKELDSFNIKYYIATLPNSSSFENSIKIHKERRGDSWVTLEVNFKVENDIKYLYNSLKDLRTDSACLLDGIFAWYVFSCKNYKKLIQPDYFADVLSEMILNTSIHWRLIDIAVYNLVPKDKYILNLLIIHKRLIRNLNIQNIIDWNYERL